MSDFNSNTDGRGPVDGHEAYGANSNGEAGANPSAPPQGSAGADEAGVGGQTDSQARAAAQGDSYGQPGPSYGQSAYPQDSGSYGRPYPNGGQPSYDQAPYGQPAYGQNPYADAGGSPRYSQQSGGYGYPQPPYGQPYGYGSVPYGYVPRQKIVAGVLGIFLGVLGVHNFYLGYTGKAVAQLLLTCLGWVLFGLGPVAAGIWSLIEAILILCSDYGSPWHRDAKGVELRD